MHQHQHRHHDDRVDPYDENERMWSGQPNETLVLELSGAAPGAVLDVGAGEGADAIWLAQQGWQVTALEPSTAALGHARKDAAAAQVSVTFVQAEIADADLPDGGFDLVSAFYPALRRTPDHRNERALLAAVKPGGELLMVHHETIDREQALAHGFDPDDYLGVSHVRELAGDDFEVVKSEVRIRTITGGRGIDYIDDAILRLRRLS